MSPRGTSNSAVRGSASDRRARRLWLLSSEAGFGGDGTTVECQVRASEKCLGRVDYETMQVDRYPNPGVLGGGYSRNNIRPGCAPCNHAEGIRLRESIRRGEIVVIREREEQTA